MCVEDPFSQIRSHILKLKSYHIASYSGKVWWQKSLVNSYSTVLVVNAYRSCHTVMIISNSIGGQLLDVTNYQTIATFMQY